MFKNFQAFSIQFIVLFFGLSVSVISAQTPEPFITTWEVEAGDLQITIPTAAGQTYNYDVDWGDGNSDTGQTGDASHTYDAAGTYTVEITGTFPQIEFFNADDRDKIMSVDQWGDIEWASMRKAFQGATNIVINASDAPDLSNATSMLEMFSGAASVNGGLENWDVSTITSMFGVFDGATSFNGDISGWDVSAVTDMIRMFAGATAFDQDIGGWTVDNVNTMESMFDGATSFNQDLSEWNTDGVGGMGWMFHDAMAFNQDLGDWDISDVTSMTEMLDGSGLSTENYDATLTGWAAQTVQSEVELGAESLTYCEAEAERQSLIADDSWDILGDDLAESCGEFRSFITTWKTNNPGVSGNQSIRIPMIGNGYDFNVDWGDGSDEDYNTNPGEDVEHFLEHTYASAGEYEVKITGDFPRIFFNNGGGVNPNNDGDHNKILTIEQWGDIEWSSMEAAFYGASNLTYNATDAPDLSGVTSLASMFKVPGSGGNSEFNGDIGNWNVSTVTTMEGMFQGADKFNQNIGGWDVSNVTTMENMFLFARAFNQDIGAWDVSNVENMDSMFQDVNSFNQDIGEWNVSSVAIMNSMFSNAHAFNQDIGDWDVSSVTTMRGMFNDTRVFNQDIGEWDVSKVTDMGFMFSNTDAFDQDIGEWDVSKVTDMSGMFYGQVDPTPFDQDISNWDVSNVTDMGLMFARAASFNQDIGGWDVSNVKNMRQMFSRARNFNQDI
ncbi:MAG: BspA family leucine-rich repeat surface protein, partial [Bacteroidetes bacterium]|nr:BspA family leucine-rich repeat surface protein [Bacteroidota bacterium]